MTVALLQFVVCAAVIVVRGLRDLLDKPLICSHRLVRLIG
jgi:hypothetical protein